MLLAGWGKMFILHLGDSSVCCLGDCSKQREINVNGVWLPDHLEQAAVLLAEPTALLLLGSARSVSGWDWAAP